MVAIGARAAGRAATGVAIGFGTFTGFLQRGHGSFFPARSSRASMTDLHEGQPKRIMTLSDASSPEAITAIKNNGTIKAFQ
jgi:hypothetical protein